MFNVMSVRSRTRALALMLITGAAAATASADVSTYLVQLQYNHEQTAAAAVAPYSYAFHSQVFAQPGDIGLARIASPGTAGEETMIQVEPGVFLYGEVFDNEPDMLDAYGPGFYTVSISGGAAGFDFGDIPIYFPVRLPSEVPQFDAATWTAMQATNPAADLTLNFNTFTTTAAAARTAVQITVASTSAGVFYEEFEAGQTSVVVPAGTLQAGETYSAAIYFIAEDEMAEAGLGSATAYSQIVAITVAPLSTAAGTCAADLNGDGLVDFADYLEFLNRYDALDPTVDFNGDGLVDFADYLEFLNLYDAGC